MRAAVILVVALTVTAHARFAHADAEATLVGELQNDSSDKVRLSAALNLTKLGDGSTKVILAMAKALGNDSSESVRGACAVGLGRLVTRRTNKTLRGLAVKSLQRAQDSDDSNFVKTQAGHALSAIGEGGSSGPSAGTSSGGRNGIYVNIGPMSSKAGRDDAHLKDLMRRTAFKAMGESAGSMMTSWPGGGAPSKAALDGKGIAGFFVDGTINKLDVREDGGGSTISCKISMLIASYPDKSMFGFLNGGAQVTASASPRDEAMASEDCITAVVEDLITKKIVPTIRSKVQ